MPVLKSYMKYVFDKYNISNDAHYTFTLLSDSNGV